MAAQDASGREPYPVEASQINQAESGPAEQTSLGELRAILLQGYSDRVAQLEAELEYLQGLLDSEEELAALMAPPLAEANRRKISQAPEEMTEALYPIVGQLVVRSVQEAVRDLQRSIDARIRSAVHPPTLVERIRTRLGGVSEGELALRNALPFQVAQVFLIHRPTGLLLWQAPGDSRQAKDSDLISGMLTAIRDFVQDAFGQGLVGDLDEIQYGDRRVLIEATQLAYVAVVVDGSEPMGFRDRVRDLLIEFSQAKRSELRHFDGDAAVLTTAAESLAGLLEPYERPQAPPMGKNQRRWLLFAVGAIVLCMVAACLAAAWVWRVNGALVASL